MPPRLQSFLANLGTLALIFAAFAYFATRPAPATAPVVSLVQTEATTSSQAAAANLPSPTPATTATATPKPVVPKPPAVQTPSDQITRIKNPYSFAPESSALLNSQARGALVNILCMSHSGSLSPISGSGVIIDPRGVILTNAHVAQYVLLSESSRIDLSCVIRTGSPATARWHAEVLYIPPVWVDAHASEINTPHPVGTGEHDYGLLLITDSADGTPVPSSFPALPYDTREAIGFQGDQVLVASYPAEFLGGLAAQSTLFPVSSFTMIGKLLTFSTNAVDLISLGGIIEAQGGSSGGEVVNAWGRLIGLIVTTSEGQTTGERDLHALTLAYINHDLAAQSQFDLPTTLGGDVAAEAQEFNSGTAPRLIQLYIDQILQH
jgi:S1-C subfamily serine protease